MYDSVLPRYVPFPICDGGNETGLTVNNPTTDLRGAYHVTLYHGYY